MARRAEGRRQRVGAVESLEGRALMSAGGLPHPHAQAVAAEVRAERLHEGAPRMGVLGDSISDEYRFYPPDRSQARNWVELLGAKRLVNFGPFSMRSRGEPRDQGFALDWARSEATTSDLLADQLPGILPQVRSGRVPLVAIIIGDNDFGDFLERVPSMGSDPHAVMAELEKVTATAEANFDTAVNTVLAADPDVKVVAGTIFDITLTPAVQAPLAAFGAQGQQLLQATSQAIGAYNANVRAFAAGHDRVALADLAAVDSSLVSRAASSGGTVAFGGVPIQVTTPGDAPDHLILADGYHPGTVAQGIIADTIVSAIDGKFGESVRPLVPGQVLHLARYARRLP